MMSLRNVCAVIVPGLSFKLCEEIRDTFPAGHILTVSVAPHQSEESPVQHYNTLLSLASLQRSSLSQNTSSSLSLSLSLSVVPPAAESLSVMNTHIASCMARLLLPVHSLTTVSLAVLAVARGNKGGYFLMSNALQKFKKGQRCVSWNPFPLDHWTGEQYVGDAPSSRLLSVCSNHSSVSCLFGHVVQPAVEMLQARAYLHWYQHYGVKEQDFQQALDACSAVMQEYDTQ
uniref:Tubulin/FtsZ 2-layer sandwich domain-containing protein n=1 Tax=Salmo trutta TaxID=8032 RepID=A0A674BV52_SALTR